ncbi:hypothetical protein KI387_033436, partial [Taxus chinensis]
VAGIKHFQKFIFAHLTEVLTWELSDGYSGEDVYVTSTRTEDVYTRSVGILEGTLLHLYDKCQHVRLREARLQ